jgi:hypothetical protein
VNVKTDILKSAMTTTSLSEGFGGFIRPTPLERAAGRLMRAPDHDSGSGDADAGADKGGSDAGVDKGEPAKVDGADAGDGEDASLLGGAADAGAGDKDPADAAGDKDAADDKGADAGDKDDDDADKEPVVPEAYDLKVQVEGEDGKPVDIEIDTELAAAATPVFKDLKLTNEQANKVAAMVPQVQQRVLQRQADDHAALRADWAKAAKEDKDIGGAKFEETTTLAARALDAFGAKSVKDKDGNETQPFRKLLNDTGLGDHPEMLKMFREIGKLVGEDGELIRSDAKPVKDKDRLEVLYPDDVPNAEKQGS